MWDSRPLIESEEINIIYYEKWMIFIHIKDLDAGLSMSCDFCGGYHDSYYCEKQFIEKEEEQKVVNIDYNSQLQTILDEFLRSNRVSFEKFEVQCGDPVEKAWVSEDVGWDGDYVSSYGVGRKSLSEILESRFPIYTLVIVSVEKVNHPRIREIENRRKHYEINKGFQETQNFWTSWRSGEDWKMKEKL
jgi:hypothetical protein